MIDIKEKKKKIISFLEENGPSLPVRIAKTIQMDPVFASAIASELLGTKQVKTSHMKIGSSPLYLIPGQEKRLEEHSSNLKSVEKEAYLKLKETKLITDEEESPAIRVAFRSIKDFATPFKFQDKIMWKYTFTPDEEINKLLSSSEEGAIPKPDVKENPRSEEGKEEPEVPKAWEVKKEEIRHAKTLSEVLVPGVKRDSKESKKVENIFEKETAEKKAPQKPKSFLKQVEEFLENKNTKLISIEEVDKKKVIAKTESNEKKALLFAFNKQRINENELMICYKEAKKQNLPYHVIILGDLTKKMNDTIDAYKKLLKVEKLNNSQLQSFARENKHSATVK